ncbi:MAG: transcriptional regulator BpuR [Spirochaetales bacterium]
MGIRGELFSTRVHSQSEKRTYFFNIKENRNGDIFLNIVESKKHGESDFERHQIVVFEEDLEAFIKAFKLATDVMKRKATGNSSYGEDRAPTS